MDTAPLRKMSSPAVSVVVTSLAPACFRPAFNTRSSATDTDRLALGTTRLLALINRLSSLRVPPTVAFSVTSPPVAVTVRLRSVLAASLLRVELKVTPPEPEVMDKLSALATSGALKVSEPEPVAFKEVCCKTRPALNVALPETLSAPPRTKKSPLPVLTVKLPV